MGTKARFVVSLQTDSTTGGHMLLDFSSQKNSAIDHTCNRVGRQILPSLDFVA